MAETYDVNLTSPTTATINLAAFYNSVKLDAAKRIGLFDGGLIAFVETTSDNNVNPANKVDILSEMMRRDVASA